ncbi:hypothetical protein [Salana multivorans]
MTSEVGSGRDGRGDARRRNVSRAALLSYAATAVSFALWVTLVVVNRVTGGEVNPKGLRADLLEVVLPLWTVLGVIAVLLALIALVRSRAKGNAICALACAVVVAAVPIIEQL